MASFEEKKYEVYNGNSLHEWMLHYGLHQNVEAVLLECGVKTLEDVAELYENRVVMKELQRQMKLIPFDQFCRVREHTTVLKSPKPLASYDGNNLLQWIAHFGLPLEFREFNDEEFGAASVEDLSVVYEKAEETIKVRNKFGLLVYARFMRARQLSKELRGRTSSTTKSISETSHSEIGKEALQQRLRELEGQHEREREEWNRRLRESLNDRCEMQTMLTQLAKTVHVVKVCFLVDCTGSMGKHIKAVKEHIEEIVDAIIQLNKNCQVQVAFVGYRDHGDTRPTERLQFTEEVSVFKTFLGQIQATGGGDTCEFVVGGLEEVRKLNWEKSGTRMLFHIGDTPGHGRAFHDFTQKSADRFPDGDPSGLKEDEIIRALRSLHIKYIFLRLNACTDKMINVFNAFVAVPDGKKFIEVHDAQTSSEKEQRAKAIGVILEQSIFIGSKSMSPSFRLNPEAIRQVICHPERPSNWSLLPPHRFVQRKMAPLVELRKLLRSFAQLPQSVDSYCLLPHSEREQLALRVPELPFATGATRQASYAKVEGTNQLGVLKEFLFEDEKKLSLANYAKSIMCLYVAKILVNEWNKLFEGKKNDKDYPRIVYCDNLLLEQTGDDGKKKYFIFETPFLENFVKFNNNAGFRAHRSQQHRDFIEALSHWTYEFCGGSMILVDCQGGYDAEENTIVMTDPGLHTEAQAHCYFGNTNLEDKGFCYFFTSHCCNRYCRELKLPNRENTMTWKEPAASR